MYRNIEHYADPTAGAALARIQRAERKDMNAGKRFEADWRASIIKVPEVWYYRFNDSPATYYGGAQEGIRFAMDNICDCQIYAYPCLHLFELKTVETPSASLTSMFGKLDMEKGQYKKEKHLRDMTAAAQRTGVTASVVINYRAKERTYACGADQVLDFLDEAKAGGRKSIPEVWCQEHGLEVGGRKLRVNYRYDVAGLIEKLKMQAQGG